MKRFALLTTLTTFAIAVPVFGQMLIQQGNVLDANMRVGSGGLNYGGRQYRFNAGNRLVTGNVTGGRSFQGFSPISDPNSLFLQSGPNFSSSGSTSTLLQTGSVVSSGLPSDQLSSFRRDSFGLTDLKAMPAKMAYSPMAYYSSSSTVLNTGAIIQGLNRPGTSQIRDSYVLPDARIQAERIDPLASTRGGMAGTLLNTSPAIVRINTGETVHGDINPRLLNSPLFGGVRAVPVASLAARAERETGLSSDAILPIDLRTDQNGQTDMRVDLRTGVPGDTADGTGLTGLAPAGDMQPGATPALRPLTQSPDVFTAMRGNRSTLVIPLTGPEAGPTAGQDAERRRPDEHGRLVQPLAGTPEAPAAPEPGATPGGAQKTVLPIAREPLKTFVGTEASVLNAYLAEAEQLLKEGQYYKAASRYDFARAVDLRNPLPLLGRSMALLAAGDYMASANNLFQAIQVFDDLGQFQVDLQSFIPDIESLDHRRADLEKRLKTFDDFRLRFLLGYAEYCSGMPELGIQHMEDATTRMPERLDAVRDFVEVLKRRTQILPPPVSRDGWRAMPLTGHFPSRL